MARVRLTSSRAREQNGRGGKGRSGGSRCDRALAITCCFCTLTSFLLGRWCTTRTLWIWIRRRRQQQQQQQFGRDGSASSSKRQRRRLPLGISQVAKGVGLTSRQEFIGAFDAVGNFGFPNDIVGGSRGQDSQDRARTREVLLLYSHRKSMPNSQVAYHQDGRRTTRRRETTTREAPHMPVAESLRNCQSLKTVLLGNSDEVPNKCVALVPTAKNQEESFLVHRFMTSPLPHDENQRTPLEYVGRLQGYTGRRWVDSIKPPMTQTHWDSLNTLLTAREAVEKELRPLLQGLEKAASPNQKTVIVLTCNKGHVDLLMNFVCHASRHGLDVAPYILIFATDKETHAVAQSMGLVSFYNHASFAAFPEEAAGRYRDETYNAMMFAKVVCVYYINRMGYHVLFQDVDILWYQNPLRLFLQTPELEPYDLIFQDDGSHNLRFSPSAGNTGFYFVRHGPLTEYLMTLVVRGADVMLGYAHQQVFIAQVDEFASLYGLRVKTIGRGDDGAPNLLPGGFHYSKRPDYLKTLMRGEATPPPFIFHMHWTESKLEKVNYLQQMGEWYLDESCRSIDWLVSTETPVLSTCCLPKPNITCHYGDRPSIVRCDNVEMKQSGNKKTFWSLGEKPPELSAVVDHSEEGPLPRRHRLSVRWPRLYNP